jgi:hypothetical protein
VSTVTSDGVVAVVGLLVRLVRLGWPKDTSRRNRLA